MRSVNAEDVAIMLSYAQKVVIVPGYGMAVAQAQHAVRELADLLEEKGIEVTFAIHPVAGRMPGHMNVLLAEANVPYTALKEMDEINPEFPQTDVVLVIGANDVVNPAARNEPGSPIYGMPILNVDQAKQIVVSKRSMATGFAGIDNPLFLDPKTAMLFGDAKESVLKLDRRRQGVCDRGRPGLPGERRRARRAAGDAPSRRCGRPSSRTSAATGRCRRRST